MNKPVVTKTVTGAIFMAVSVLGRPLAQPGSSAGACCAMTAPMPHKAAMAAKVDELGPAARIVGAVFWAQALAAVEVEAAEQLPALVQRELALPRADLQADGLREYAFRHQLLHQVTYSTVLKRHKREGHALVAQWLAALTQQGSLRAGDFLGLAAEHFELAGDEAQAAEFHARAAEPACASATVCFM